MTTPKKTATTNHDPLTAEIQMQLSRIGPLEEVLKQRDAELRELRERLQVAEAAAKRTKNALQELEYSQAELKTLKTYRTLMQGWPAGQEIVDRLNRDPYED